VTISTGTFHSVLITSVMGYTLGLDPFV
jgi:hypothetical protein